ncbi:Cellulose synthase subunit D [Paramixta manurensis]|uniref:Cellulose synthase subunit D n=1 Tax=Paramixta manurensis TaxID=2740817 RepID=A0A6M8U9H6_9GAMM|nr:Cellulose synthase subunit D [Erwiniaceae bacterium PD-1]
MNAQQHAYQPGWFDLFSIMVSGMLENAGEEESHAFLRQTGDDLAARYPLAEARTVQDLETQINLALARFNWGFVEIQPQENALTLLHMALPEGRDELAPALWRRALGAVFSGLYARWLRDQGGHAQVPLSCDAEADASLLLFRYQKGL